MNLTQCVHCGLIVAVVSLSAHHEEAHTHTPAPAEQVFSLGKFGVTASSTSSAVSVTPGTGTLSITGYAPLLKVMKLR